MHKEKTNEWRLNRVKKPLLVTTMISVLIFLGLNALLASPQSKSSVADEMHYLQREIWDLNKRLQKKPDNLYFLKKITEARNNYIKQLDFILDLRRNDIKANPGDLTKLENFIKTSEEKIGYLLLLRAEYIRLVRLVAADNENLNTLIAILTQAYHGPSNVNIELLDADKIKNKFDRLKTILEKQAGIHAHKVEEAANLYNYYNIDVELRVNEILRLIDEKRKENSKFNQDKIEALNKQIKKAESKLFKYKKKFLRALKNKINHSQSSAEKNGLINKSLRMLDDCLLKLEKIRVRNVNDPFFQERWQWFIKQREELVKKH
jgi:hypothetical protein